MVTVRIIRPCSREEAGLLQPRVDTLKDNGFKVLYDDIPVDPQWPFSAGSVKDRSVALNNALLEAESQAVLCIRGGYGAADLLPLIPWKKLKNAPPKLFVGFSDLCAVHSALMSVLEWQGVHAPMPGSTLWPADKISGDINNLFSILKDEKTVIQFPLRPLNNPTSRPKSGWLFGGNLSVLSNLIGTPYFPKSLAGAIIFLEDLTEPPGRLHRQFMQWVLAGLFDNVRAIVFGSFTKIGRDFPDDDPRLIEQFVSRVKVPCYKTESFGHVSPNYPLQYGARARIEGNSLTWTFEPSKLSS